MHNNERGKGVNPAAVAPGNKVILGVSFSDDDPEAEIDRMVETRRRAARDGPVRSASMLARHFIADVPPKTLWTC